MFARRGVVLAATGLLATTGAPGHAASQEQEALRWEIDRQLDDIVENMSQFAMRTLPALRWDYGVEVDGVHRYPIAVEAGARMGVAVVCDSDCNDIDVWIEDGDGDVVAVDESRSSWGWVSFTPQDARRHQVRVRAPGCHHYHSCLYGGQIFMFDPTNGGRRRVLIETLGMLSTSDERSDGGDYVDRYTVKADASGGALIINLMSADFDTMVYAWGPLNESHQNDDFEGQTDISRITVPIPRSGRWNIAVSSYETGATGEYHLIVTQERR
ncbi:MAG: hypothetical protein AAF389_02600 [Gemmatimonadota bacterium]